EPRLEARLEVDLTDAGGLESPDGLQLAQTDLDDKGALLAVGLKRHLVMGSSRVLVAHHSTDAEVLAGSDSALMLASCVGDQRLNVAGADLGVADQAKRAADRRALIVAHRQRGAQPPPLVGTEAAPRAEHQLLQRVGQAGDVDAQPLQRAP